MIFYSQRCTVSKIQTHPCWLLNKKNCWNTSLRNKQKHVPWLFNDMFGLQCVLIDKSVGAVTGEKERWDNSQQSSGINLTAFDSLFPSALVSVPPPLKIGHSPRSLQFKSLSLYSGSKSLVEDDWHVALSKPGRKTPRSISYTDQPNHIPVGRMCDFMEKTCGEVHELSRCCFPTSKRSFRLVLWEGFP